MYQLGFTLDSPQNFLRKKCPLPEFGWKPPVIDDSGMIFTDFPMKTGPLLGWKTAPWMPWSWASREARPQVRWASWALEFDRIFQPKIWDESWIWYKSINMGTSNMIEFSVAGIFLMDFFFMKMFMNLMRLSSNWPPNCAEKYQNWGVDKRNYGVDEQVGFI